MTSDPRMPLLLEALAQFQAEHSVVDRSASGSFGPYTDLSAVLQAVREANKLGLSVIQTFDRGPEPGVAVMTTWLYHKSGAHISSELPVVLFYEATKRNTSNQQLGATITYLRRYAVMAILGMASQDTEDNRTPQSGVAITPQQSGNPIDDFGLGPSTPQASWPAPGQSVQAPPATFQPGAPPPALPMQQGQDEFGLG